jgi:bacterioferritin-associated ferredoxin
VLGDKALQAAINDYFRKTGQHDRIITAGAKVIDKDLHITDHDIEEAVLEGAQSIEDVQKKLKVGVAKPEARHAIEELIRFYYEKYYS